MHFQLFWLFIAAFFIQEIRTEVINSNILLSQMAGIRQSMWGGDTALSKVLVKLDHDLRNIDPTAHFNTSSCIALQTFLMHYQNFFSDEIALKLLEVETNVLNQLDKIDCAPKHKCGYNADTIPVVSYSVQCACLPGYFNPDKSAISYDGCSPDVDVCALNPCNSNNTVCKTLSSNSYDCSCIEDHSAIDNDAEHNGCQPDSTTEETTCKTNACKGEETDMQKKFLHFLQRKDQTLKHDGLKEVLLKLEAELGNIATDTQYNETSCIALQIYLMRYQKLLTDSLISEIAITESNIIKRVEKNRKFESLGCGPNSYNTRVATYAYKCACKPGFTHSEERLQEFDDCTPIDACSSRPCAFIVNSSCQLYGETDYKCKCHAGYVNAEPWDRTSRCVLDFCSDRPCNPYNTICDPLVNNGQCSCMRGYSPVYGNAARYGCVASPCRHQPCTKSYTTCVTLSEDRYMCACTHFFYPILNNAEAFGCQRTAMSRKIVNTIGRHLFYVRNATQVGTYPMIRKECNLNPNGEMIVLNSKRSAVFLWQFMKQNSVKPTTGFIIGLRSMGTYLEWNDGRKFNYPMYGDVLRIQANALKFNYFAAYFSPKQILIRGVPLDQISKAVCHSREF